jgi:hypothetical protein
LPDRIVVKILALESLIGRRTPERRDVQLQNQQ